METSKLSHVIAYNHSVGEETLHKLQGMCADEVKRINDTMILRLRILFKERPTRYIELRSYVDVVVYILIADILSIGNYYCETYFFNNKL